MMSVPPSSKPTAAGATNAPLNMSKPDILLRQLRAPEYAAALRMPFDADSANGSPDSPRYPHAIALSAFFRAGTASAREKWALCLLEMVDQRLPYNETGGQAQIAYHFCVGRRKPTSDAPTAPVVALFMAYRKAGLIDLDARLVDDNLPRQTPLEIAIKSDNEHAAKMLVKFGASLDIRAEGYGEEPLDAHELALREGMGAVAAAMTEREMLGNLRTTSIAAAETAPGPRRTPL